MRSSKNLDFEKYLAWGEEDVAKGIHLHLVLEHLNHCAQACELAAVTLLAAALLRNSDISVLFLDLLLAGVMFLAFLSAPGYLP